MKILILGAGGVGGYFGARLIQAGADVTYLLRDKRHAKIQAEGLEIGQWDCFFLRRGSDNSFFLGIHGKTPNIVTTPIHAICGVLFPNMLYNALFWGVNVGQNRAKIG